MDEQTTAAPQTPKQDDPPPIPVKLLDPRSDLAAIEARVKRIEDFFGRRHPELLNPDLLKA